MTKHQVESVHTEAVKLHEYLTERGIYLGVLNVDGETQPVVLWDDGVVERQYLWGTIEKNPTTGKVDY